MTITRLPTSCDLSEQALIDAATMLGDGELYDMTVYCSLDNRQTARQLQALHGFELVMVPAFLLLHGRDSWAVSYANDIVWSLGA